MTYRISSLYVKNFKCFDNNKFYCFKIDESRNPIILSGPNGFGKTTFFDAIELIFTKKITRLFTSIEDGKTNIGRNILLNQTDYNGILILNLIDDNKRAVAVVAKIDKNSKKLQEASIKDSIEYRFCDKPLVEEDEIISFLEVEADWSATLSECAPIKNKVEDFNIYYYISQAESVHFLKRNIKDRKSSVDSLLNLENVENYINYIEKELIGATKTKKDVLINREIQECENLIEKKANKIIEMRKTVNQGSQPVDYEQLINYPKEAMVLQWDKKDSIFNKNSICADLNKFEGEINSLHQYAINRDDFKIHLKNQSIDKLLRNKENISDFIKYYDFIENDALNTSILQEDINSKSRRLEVYKYSKFFREDFDLSIYKKEDMLKLQKIDTELILNDIDYITNKVNEILNLEKENSSDQKFLLDLQQARDALHKHSEVSIDSSCPYCNYQYANAEELETQFTKLSSELINRKSDKSKKIEKLTKTLHSKLEISNQNICAYISGLNEHSIVEFSRNLQNDINFSRDANRIQYVNKVYELMKSHKTWKELEEEFKEAEVESTLSLKRIPYKNEEFMTLFDKYNFFEIDNKYKDIFSLVQSKIISTPHIENKITFLKQEYSLAKLSELRLLKNQLKKEVIKKKKLNILREKLSDLCKLYKHSMNDYKTQIIKKLRIPLLIYSGKILQDYQNGLGIFINQEDMRFVANGDAKHDILNTFSSGQLSGFVLAFLFAMNKQFVNKSEDNIGFILIDDPVQTMDDINIASLIEVLRNDFLNKQIILSTHETDKENYILYKFLKYNQKGQSFNVKEQLYL